jgi:hypothetical protein
MHFGNRFNNATRSVIEGREKWTYDNRKPQLRCTGQADILEPLRQIGRRQPATIDGRTTLSHPTGSMAETECHSIGHTSCRGEWIRAERYKIPDLCLRSRPIVRRKSVLLQKIRKFGFTRRFPRLEAGGLPRSRKKIILAQLFRTLRDSANVVVFG